MHWFCAVTAARDGAGRALIRQLPRPPVGPQQPVPRQTWESKGREQMGRHSSHFRSGETVGRRLPRRNIDSALIGALTRDDATDDIDRLGGPDRTALWGDLPGVFCVLDCASGHMADHLTKK